MTGPEHYREAERIASAATRSDRAHEEGFTGWERADLAALALVHATLADAAATAESIAEAYTSGEDHRVAREWTAAIS